MLVSIYGELGTNPLVTQPEHRQTHFRETNCYDISNTLFMLVCYYQQ